MKSILPRNVDVPTRNGNYNLRATGDTVPAQCPSERGRSHTVSLTNIHAEFTGFRTYSCRTSLVWRQLLCRVRDAQNRQVGSINSLHAYAPVWVVSECRSSKTISTSMAIWYGTVVEVPAYLRYRMNGIAGVDV